MNNRILTVIQDPGVLFCMANVFVFSQSGNLAALFLSVATLILAVDQSGNHNRTVKGKIRQKVVKMLSLVPQALLGDPQSSALRVNAYGVLACGILALSSGALLPGFAGLAFSTGNFLASSSWSQMIQRNSEIKGRKKALTNPAVYYGVGYAMLGLMAGGGLALWTDPFQHIPALVTTILGVTVTSLSAIGLAFGKFQNPAAPFMMVAFGTGINILSGFLSGNFQGSINNFLSMCGEVRLGQINYRVEQTATQTAEDADHSSFFGKLFTSISRLLLFPLAAWEKRQSKITTQTD